MLNPSPAVEVLLPAHNEAESIAPTISEIYDELSPQVSVQFIITEDGSTDGTKEVLARLSEQYPMKLVTSDDRKGYGPAVVDGMRQLGAPFLLCLDSDGQCDPKDFATLWQARDTADVVVGWRVRRNDTWMRRSMSRFFFSVYQMFYGVPVHDPSCPFVLAHRAVIERLAPEMGEMKQGFWWEFIARAHRRGFSIREFPVNHRNRFAGETRVYHLAKLPGIGYRHFLALFKVWRQTSS